MTMKFYLRADANQEIGTGHVMRLIGLADRLMDRLTGSGFSKEDVVLACREIPDEVAAKAQCTVLKDPSCPDIGEPGWLTVVDSYTIPAIEPKVFKMRDHYWFLRDELRGIRRGRTEMKTIGVSLGGGSAGNTKFGDYVLPDGIKSLMHPAFADYAKCLEESDVMIGAFGVSSWERCYLGIPTVGMIIADNQIPNAVAQTYGLAAFGADSEPRSIATALTLLHRHPELLQLMSKKAMELAPDDSYRDFWVEIKKGFMT